MNEVTEIKFIKVCEVVDTTDAQYSFRKILEKVLSSEINLYVLEEWAPAIFEWGVVDKDTIKKTYLGERDSFYHERFERYGPDSALSPEDWAVIKGNISNIWLSKDQVTAFKALFKKSESKNSSLETQIQILEVIVKVLSTDIENTALSPLLRTEKDSKKISAKELVKVISEKSSAYFDNAEDGELPRGFGDRLIQDTFSQARKKIVKPAQD